MLKYKYLIDAGNFTNITEFQAYLNRMGKKGYELIQWQLCDINTMSLEYRSQPVNGILSVLITWKIEDHDS